jgi:hypothetical protein
LRVATLAFGRDIADARRLLGRSIPGFFDNSLEHALVLAVEAEYLAAGKS